MANLKGQNQITGFLLLHGEKIGIAVVAVISLWFVYSSFSLPKLDDAHQAPELQKKINETSNEIKSFTWDAAVKQFPEKVKQAIPVSAKTDLTVKPADYVNTDSKGRPSFDMDGLVIAPMTRRSDPELLNAEDVRAIGGSGLFAFLDEKVRHEQELRRQAEEEAKAKKEAERQKKLEKQQKENTGLGNRRRGSEGPGGVATEPYDPAHPKRRPLEGSIHPAGAPLQGGERIEQAYWACVVAKIPIRQQANLYEDAFKDARGYDQLRDFPTYVGYYVERAEVVPGKALEWKPVPLYDGQRKSIAQNKPLTAPPEHAVGDNVVSALLTAAQQFWAGGIAPDVVDDRFRDYTLTLPLPPLVGREWGANVTHPDIPLAVDTPPLEETAPQSTAQPQQQTSATSSPFGSPDSGQAGSPGFNSFMPGRPTGEYPGRPSLGGPGRFTGPEMRGPGGPAMAGAGSGSMAGHHTALTKGVDFYLLRFFDFAVQPGKQYRYRVQLVLKDPNYNLPASELAGAVQDRQAKVARDNKGMVGLRRIHTWSEPSPTVGIPLAGDIRLVDAKIPPPDKFNDEPSVSLLVESVGQDDQGNPIQAAIDTSSDPHEKKEFRRGYVANMVADAEYLVEANTAIDTYPNFKFQTGMTVLDIDGGTHLARDMTVPSRILVMGPAGQFYIRNELDDKPLVDYHRLLFEKSNDRESGPGGGPGRKLPPGPRGRRR
ncbi:MAG TPA: hypothetical protein VFW73_02445 [Lacipirellulaceae bacterium]|nr:hypothetical protein [Lacipirellulaceae bacterium]